MARKRKNSDSAYASRPPKKSLQSTQPSASPPPEVPLTTTRRSGRLANKPRNYTELTADAHTEDSETEVKPNTKEESDLDSDRHSELGWQQSASSIMSSNQSMSSRQSMSPDQSDSDEGLRGKRRKANNGRAHRPAKSTPESAASAELVEVSNSSKQQANLKPKKTKVNMRNLNKGMKKDVNQTLPPLSDITSIFTHLVGKGFQKAPNCSQTSSLEDVCKHVGPRPLRVATMCSGTESPLLAWDMISECIQKRGGGLELNYEHVFSAEIVPFKQAYIERNFRPPIIFRDITEITSSTDGKAATAYGAQVDIPGNVDMVIAGTACVDFSNLNNHQKSLEERGESGDTFAAVLAYAQKYRPTMLVLENVFGAPWDKMLAEYEDNEYVSAGVLVDSKNYYLPQTRQRGYMVCIDSNKLEACGIDPAVFKEEFHDRMADFRRPVSSPLSSFILPNDDPLVTRASQSLARQSLLDSSLREVDWAKCEIRHINYRKEKALGIARPMTNWQESGTLVLPENCSRLWFSKQVERVWDFVDMSLLRKANATIVPKNKKTNVTPAPLPGYDAQYKTRIWDVSQNIDRFTDGAPFGIAPCLTPSGNFYLTERGAPLTYTESLMLQGLPLDRISFTTETERNIQDLAGNAMSTTVVGSAIASVLISGFKTLPQTSDRTSETKNTPFKSIITSVKELIDQKTSQTTAEGLDFCELQADAIKSATMCVCEGQIGLSDKAIQTCNECGHTSCLTCGVKPSHEYGKPCSLERGRPEEFVQKWRPRLPVALKFDSIGALMSLIDPPPEVNETRRRGTKVTQKKTTKIKQSDSNKKYTTAVREALEHAFTFKAFRRTSSWIIIYESSFARLELVLGEQTCQWKLYAKPGDELSGDDEIRKFFEEPIATAQVTEDAFFGNDWRWRLLQDSKTSSSQLTIRGQGERVPSWAARLGLPKHAEDRVWSELNIEPSSGHVLPSDIEGTYKLLRNCGTASESLYKRFGATEGSSMFLFLDPRPIGKPEFDCFVFARDHSKLHYDQAREITARVDAAWRPETQTNTPSCLEISLNGHWVEDDSCSLREEEINPILRLKHPSPQDTDCHATKALVSLKFDLPSSISYQRYQGHRQIQPDDKVFFDAFGWAMEPLRQSLKFSGAQDLPANPDCGPCAPPVPGTNFRVVPKKNGTTEFQSYEDSKTARDYEAAIKSRPQPFVIECQLQDKSATLSIGLNATTMCHRAAAKLKTLTESVDSVAWTLDTTWIEEASAKFPPFTLCNNSDNVQCVAAKEVLIGIELFDIQQRSLTWMKEQESAVGRSFVVNEIEEALLPHVGWRLEATASTEVHIKGGILADHAGFGKTVTSLALIESEFKEKTRKLILEDMCANAGDAQPQLIPLAATLVVCPDNLVGQWAEEVQKLVPMKKDGSELIVIKNIKELGKHNEKGFAQAKIIIVGKRVLALDEKSLEQFAMFTAMPDYTGKNSRGLQSYLRDATSRIPKHLDILRKPDGSVKLQKHLTQLYKETLKNPQYHAYAEESKRVKGKAYAKKKKNASEVSSVLTEDLDRARTYRNNDKYMLLEMFQFNRLVVDEFSYTEPHELIMYCNINATKRWALSATPRLKDTYDVSRMAKFLGLELPIGASAPGLLSSANMSALRKDMTNMQQFETFRELPSRNTQKSIYLLAQEFLNTFLRQNLMRHDQYPYEDEMVTTTLYADNRLVYTDLSQKFNSQDMRIRKGRNRVAELSVMPNVTTAEEALLCTAAIYDPLRQLSSNVPRKDISLGLEALVERYEELYSKAQNSLLAKMVSCVENSGKSKQFTEWVKNVVSTNVFGDQAVAHEIAGLANMAAAEAKQTRKRPRTGAVAEDKPDIANDEDSDEPENYMTAAQENAIEQETPLGNLKDKISDAVGDAKAYVASTRTLRFVKNALKHERRHQDPSNRLSCDGKDCDNIINDSEDLHLSANCGHALCTDCIVASKNLLGNCPVSGCNKEVRSYHLLDLGKLGESTASDYGSKADGLTKLLKTIATQGEQAILFVQFTHQIEGMVKILDRAEISHHRPTADKEGPFKSFTKNKKKTVLILNSNDESAAGANLTNANHVIFFSPLLKRTQYEYEAQMAQAIGRVRRPGQDKPVRVYRFVALDTIDVDILEHREHRTSIMSEYQDSECEKTVPGTNFEAKLKQKLVKPEKTQLIRDHNGEFKLVPRQLLLAAGGAGVFEGTERILGYAKYNSLIKFSSGFIQDD
ncbi:hypothetical protein E4T48_07929 [Aureobasidium sp. EXF-10727]|nr:hypothetical protein E4T48_07929 [Aureobasidium sp. EXF-10727]